MDKIKVLLIKPKEKAKCVEIENTLESLQSTVGGYIETVYPFKDDVVLICNDEGINLNLDLNRPLIHNGVLYDVICGDFIVAGTTVDDFASLTEEQINKYKTYYDRYLYV